MDPTAAPPYYLQRAYRRSAEDGRTVSVRISVKRPGVSVRSAPQTLSLRLERGLPLVLFLQIVLDEPHSEVDSLRFRGELEVGGATIPLGDLRVAAIVWSDGGRTGHVVIAGQVPQTAMTGAGRVHIELREPSPGFAGRSSANITLR